jgi:hypothetical protein
VLSVFQSLYTPVTNIDLPESCAIETDLAATMSSVNENSVLMIVSRKVPVIGLSESSPLSG